MIPFKCINIESYSSYCIIFTILGINLDCLFDRVNIIRFLSNRKESNLYIMFALLIYLG